MSTTAPNQTYISDPAHRRRILASMSFALLLVIATITAVNLALPEMAVEMEASFTQITWIADAYTVVIAALVLPLGALSDRVGRKRTMLTGLILFAVIAFAAAMQTTPTGVIVTRALMGASAAMIMPGTLATITSTFPDEERTKAVATWAGIAGAGAVFGLVSSGLLLEFWSWPSVFIFSGTVGIIAVIAVWRGAPETGSHHVRIDVPGSALSAIGFGALVWGIIDGGEAGWTDPRALSAILGGVLALVAWVMYSRRTTDPLLDMHVFANPYFTVGAIAVISQFLAQFGFIFIAMQYLQLVLDFSPLTAAVAMFPLAIVVVPLSQLVPRLPKRIPVKVLLPLGLVGLILGLLTLASMHTESGYLRFAFGLMVLGVGVAFTAPPATTAITEGLSRDKQGTASAVNDVTRELGAALGIAIMGATFTSTYRDSVTPFLTNLPADAAGKVAQSPSAGLQIAEKLGPMGAQLHDGVLQGFMDGTQISLLVVAGFLGVIAVLITTILWRSDDHALTTDTAINLVPEEDVSLALQR